MTVRTLTFSLAGSAYLVTGASGGIGAATCAALAAAGASVVAVDREMEPVRRLVAGLPGPGSHLAQAADLSDLGTHDELVSAAFETCRRLDGLVHLAATIRRRRLEDVTEDDWDAQLDLNLKATFFLNRVVAGHLRDQGGGTITNFTSHAWWSGGLNGSIAYAASKAGVVAVSRGLARELAADGVRVNTIAPGLVDTPMMRDETSEERLREFVDELPLRRMATPAEIAGAAVFLASPAGAYVTGATLNLTGGQLMY